MMAEYAYFMLCFLVPRLFTGWKDTGNNITGSMSVRDSARTILIELLLEFLFILPVMSGGSFPYLLSFVFFYHLMAVIMSRYMKNGNLRSLVEFVLLILAGGFFIGGLPETVSFQAPIFSVLANFLRLHPFMRQYSRWQMRGLIIIIFGAVVLVNEINAMVRYILSIIHSEPLAEAGQPDSRELGRGKIIGVIERLFFYFFVLTNNYGSIAFILAAKAFTRFRELEDRDFAEYVLIGTLLSSSLSIFWAYFIRTLVL